MSNFKSFLCLNVACTFICLKWFQYKVILVFINCNNLGLHAIRAPFLLVKGIGMLSLHDSMMWSTWNVFIGSFVTLDREKKLRLHTFSKCSHLRCSSLFPRMEHMCEWVLLKVIASSFWFALPIWIGLGWKQLVTPADLVGLLLPGSTPGASWG